VATDGNVSQRLAKDVLVSTPAGLCKGMLAPTDLVKTDLDGKLLPGQQARPSTELLMHLSIYRKRRDVQAVVHAHPPYATAFAVAGLSLEGCILPEVILTMGAVPLAPYGTPSTEEIPKAIEQYIENYDSILLANHGVVTVGKSLLEAYFRMERVEHFAKVTFVARMLGSERVLTEEEIAKLREVQEKSGGEIRPIVCRTCPVRTGNRE
jgi:L-fuculose-phosphate aldolase